MTICHCMKSKLLQQITRIELFIRTLINSFTENNCLFVIPKKHTILFFLPKRLFVQCLIFINFIPARKLGFDSLRAFSTNTYNFYFQFVVILFDKWLSSPFHFEKTKLCCCQDLCSRSFSTFSSIQY